MMFDLNFKVPKFKTELDKKEKIPKDKLGRKIKEGDIIIKQNPSSGLNELWLVSLNYKSRWYVSKLVDKFYTVDPGEEYLPYNSRLCVTRKTVEIKVEDFSECFLLCKIKSNVKL